LVHVQIFQRRAFVRRFYLYTYTTTQQNNNTMGNMFGSIVLHHTEWRCEMQYIIDTYGKLRKRTWKNGKSVYSDVEPKSISLENYLLLMHCECKYGCQVRTFVRDTKKYLRPIRGIDIYKFLTYGNSCYYDDNIPQIYNCDYVKRMKQIKDTYIGITYRGYLQIFTNYIDGTKNLFVSSGCAYEKLFSVSIL